MRQKVLFKKVFKKVLAILLLWFYIRSGLQFKVFAGNPTRLKNASARMKGVPKHMGILTHAHIMWRLCDYNYE